MIRNAAKMVDDGHPAARSMCAMAKRHATDYCFEVRGLLVLRCTRGGGKEEEEEDQEDQEKAGLCWWCDLACARLVSAYVHDLLAAASMSV
jgi:hypothetical protein